MRLREGEAMAYLEANGHKCSTSKYWKCRSYLQATKLKRLTEMAGIGFEDQHIERIDTLEWAHQELVKQYHLAQAPGVKARIMQQIIDLQPYLGGFYYATKKVLDAKRPESIL